MKILHRRFFAILLLVAVIVMTGFVITFAAGDCDGTTGNDVINCITNPTTPDTQVDGDLGNDVITVGQNVTTDFIDADGQSGAADQAGAGNGGNDTIVNNGTVTVAISGDYVTGAGGNDNITNNGSANIIYGDEAAGTVTASGSDIIINNGTANTIIADDNLTAGASDTVVNNGTVTGLIDAGGGNDAVTNTGSAGAIDAGAGNDNVTNTGIAGTIDGGDGNNVVTNNGTVTNDVVTGSGADHINNNGSVGGGIDAGSGSDTVTVGDGATVNGTIDGGAGTDTLYFTFNTPAAASAAAAILAGQSPAGGTVTIGGQVYTWVNFEQLQAILVATVGKAISVKVGIFKDGRLNAYDLGAPFAVYCVPNEYVQVIDIHPDGNNPLAFRTDFKTVNDAVTKAKKDFNFVAIASGEGDYLSAMMDGTLVAYGPTFDGTKIYRFVFNPDCTYNGIGSES